MYSINNSFGLRTAFASVFPDLCKGDYLNQIKSTEEIKMEEIWKPIKNYEGLYEISNFGRVKSLSNRLIDRTGRPYGKRERILKTRIDSNGYPHVYLFDSCKGKNVKVHILVWEHFGTGKRNGLKLVIDHIDEEKTNNRIDNLQLLTARQNVSKYNKTQPKTSSYTGVSKSRGKWRAQAKLNGKKTYLGIFDSEEEAKLCYENAILKLNEGVLS